VKTSKDTILYLRSADSFPEIQKRIKLISFINDELPEDIRNNPEEKNYYLYKIFLILSTYIVKASEMNDLTADITNVAPTWEIPHINKLFQDNTIPDEKTFFDLLYLVDSFEEMQGLLKFISFDMQRLPADLNYDNQVFIGFIVKLYVKTSPTNKWKWFLDALDEECQLKPLKEQWYEYIGKNHLYKHLTGLKERIEI